MPADPRNAGKDKGNLEMELKNLLTSARIRKMEYEAIIEELEEDELKYDLFEYKEYYETDVKPYIDKAYKNGSENLIAMAEEIKGIFEEIIDMITARIEELSKK
ncbi:hypothetical protein [Aquifex sp.]